MLDDVTRRKVTVFVVIAVLCVVAIALLYGIGVHTHWGRDLDEVAYEGRSVAKPAATQASERLLRTISRTSLALLGGAVVLTARAPAAAAAGARGGRGARRRGAVGRGAEARDPRPAGRHVDRGDPDQQLSERSHDHRHVARARVGGGGRAPLALAGRDRGHGGGDAVRRRGAHHRLAPSVRRAGRVLLSLAWYSLVMAALVRWRGRGDPQRLHADVVEERAGPLLTTLVGALLLAALTVVLVASLETDGLRTVPYSADYVLATLLIDVAGIVIVGAFHLLMRDVSPDPPAPGRGTGQPSVRRCSGTNGRWNAPLEPRSTQYDGEHEDDR